MATIEFRGGPVTHRSLMNKSKSDLAHDYMGLLRCWEGMKKRAEKAEAQLTAARAEGERLGRECKPFKACHCSLSSECHVIQDQPCEICEGPVDATPEVVEAMFRGYEAQLTAARAEGERMREALAVCDRVLHFDLRHMIQWGDDYNQAVKDAADATRAALTGASEKEGSR